MQGTNNYKEINTIMVFGFRVFSDNLVKIPFGNTCSMINTISPNSYGISTKDPVFRKALKDSDYLVLDGVYFALSSLLLFGKTIRRNQGPDMFFFFMNKLNQINGKAFFLGSSVDTLQKIKKKAAIQYPNISIDFFSPPYKTEFSETDNFEALKKINCFSPDILFVGMTAPKQEKWVYQHKVKINAKLAISIGGVFDWYGGNEKSVGSIWWKLRLVWLIRTIQRPEILKRYPNIFIFFKHLLLALLGFKKYKYGNF